MNSEPILEVINLKKYFPVQRSFVERLFARKMEYVKAVDGISFKLKKGEIFTLAGESGCGKTTTGRLILRLIKPTSGKILFEGKDLTLLSEKEMMRMRRRMQIVFQDPYSSLSPYMKIGDIIGHPLKIHGLAKGEEEAQVLAMLERVGLSPPEKFYKLYPHQLSGGQRQRVAFARAMILKPDFIVADEPVSMLDVSIRASILELMMDLKERYSLTYLFITHDLAVAKYISNRVAIMYLGKIVEIGKKKDIFSNPLHPYTQALLSAVPIPDPTFKPKRMLLKGEIPSPINLPPGCRLSPRCPKKIRICEKEEPKLIEIENGHSAACHLLS